MNKIPITLLCSLLWCFLLSSCGEKKITGHYGVPAQILEITNGVDGMVVKPLTDNSILGDVCYLNCNTAQTVFIYVDTKMDTIESLTFADFKLGDYININVDAVVNDYAEPQQIQLLDPTNIVSSHL